MKGENKMGNIDLVTIVHPEDKREPKFKYTFKAPVNSGIEKDDYVIADIKGKETLGKVISVLENVDEDSQLMNYIRTVSTIKDQKLKPLSYKLEKVALEYEKADSEKENDPLIIIPIGAIYYSIEQEMSASPREFRLFVCEYTYCDCEADAARLKSGNMFFHKGEAERIIEILSNNINDKSKMIDIKKALKMIL
jgi:hypothetical protein